MVVDLGVLEEFPTNTIPGFVEALVALHAHASTTTPARSAGAAASSRASARAPGPGHVAEHVALELQNLAGTRRPPRQDARHGRARPLQRDLRVPRGAGRHRGGPQGRRASSTTSWRPTTRPRLRLRRPSSRASSASPSGSPSGRPRRRSSTRRPAATSRTSASTGTRLVQLGQGVHQQRIRATMTSRTSGIAVDIASDKKLTNRLLDSAGLPVPRSEVVDTEDDAVAAARRLGYPVRRQAARRQPRPRRRPRPAGRGRRPRRLPRGAAPEPRAATSSWRSYITGHDYRCLVIGGKLAAVAERVPASVTGDGEQTVRELVDDHQRRPAPRHRPREGPHPDQARRRRRGGRSRARASRSTTVPPAGAFVKLALTGNMSHRRHVDRPDVRGPPRQRRDRRDGGPRRRPRHRRHRLHLPRHRRARPRDRRRHRGGQRRARLPDAHPPDRGRAAVRGQAGHRPAVPARRRRPASRSSPSPAPTARRRRSG